MEWIPAFQLGWLNGWIPVVWMGLTDTILFRIFPREVVDRLFDRSGWSRKQVIWTVLGKLVALVCIVLLTLTPLKIGSIVFIVGLVVVVLGWAGLVWALFTYRYTPLGEPVTHGLSRVSRHPQIVMSSLILLGGCIMIGSCLAVLLFTIVRVFSHQGILAEEERCLAMYGESYQQYLDSVPRYFVLF